MAPPERRCEVLGPDQRWREVPKEHVVVGQVFRLFEADGSPVEDADGCRRWRLLSGPMIDEDGGQQVELEPIPETDVERTATAMGHWWPGLSGFGRLRGR